MSKNNKVTISSIAELLDVSAITVSRALANQPGVSDELRKKIIDTANELGYKRCRSRAKISILLLIRRRYVADHSNFSQLVEGIEACVQDLEAELTLEFVDAEKQSELVLPYNLTRGKRYDGVIFLGRFTDEYAAQVRQVVPNIVIINGRSDSLKCSYVFYNYSRMGFNAAEYLIGKGHTRIGLVGMEDSYSRALRCFGMQRAFEKHGISFNKDYIINSKKDLGETIKALIDRDNLPTAFICQSDRIALKLIKLLYEYEISVPQDVSVIGSGNSDISGMTIPAITTFEVNIQTVCEAAVNTLFAHINNADKVCRTILIDNSLVERDSVSELTDMEG